MEIEVNSRLYKVCAQKKRTQTCQCVLCLYFQRVKRVLLVVSVKRAMVVTRAKVFLHVNFFTCQICYVTFFKLAHIKSLRQINENKVKLKTKTKLNFSSNSQK